MIAYSYDSITKEYVGTRPCQLDPLETQAAGYDIWLLPANSTFETPPEKKEGFIIVWDNDAWTYQEVQKEPEPEIYVPTLDDIKARKITELKRIRDEKELEPITFENHRFDFDLKSYNRITAAADVLDRADILYQQAMAVYQQNKENNQPDTTGLTQEELEYLQDIENTETESDTPEDPMPIRPTIVWTTADNDNVELSADGLHGIIQAAAMRSNMLHVQYRALKERVLDADSVESVEAVTWNSYQNEE